MSGMRYGRHNVRGVDGFHNSLEEVLNCAAFTGRDKDEIINGKQTILAHNVEIVHHLETYFQLAAGILTEDIGIEFDASLTHEVLRSYLAGRFYCWPQASLANLPWLMARTLNSYTVIGRVLRDPKEKSGETAKALLNHVPALRLNAASRVQYKTHNGPDIRFGLKLHKRFAPHPHATSAHAFSGEETIIFFLTMEGEDQPFHEKTIQLRTHALEQRIAQFKDRPFTLLASTQQARRTIDAYRRADPEFAAQYAAFHEERADG